MFAIYLYLSGLFIFVLGTGILGLDLRRHRSEESAEMYSRIMQSLFYVGEEGLVGTRPMIWP